MVVVDLVAGTLAGFGICAVGHPFDTLKVLMQMQPEKYPGMVAAARETVSKHGMLGLYKGVSAPLIGNGFYNAVQFAVFGTVKKIATDNGKRDTLGRIAAAGAFTGIFVALVEGPQDLFKSQMQAQMMSKTAMVPVPVAGVVGGPAIPVAAAPVFKGLGDVARYIMAQRGLIGVTQGLDATIVRNIIGVSAYFYFYEMVRRGFAGKTRKVADLSTWEVLMAGGCGGVGYWVLCYPMDIIKSAIQTDAIDPAQRRYGSIPATAAKLWAEGGARRFTAGVVPCLARSFPANAVGFAVYEATKKTLEPAGE